jgi:hypothetical protein
MKRDVTDIVSGGLLITIGLMFFLPALGYGIGSVTAMRAGYFPMAVSVIMMVLGAAIMAQGLTGRLTESEKIAWRPLFAVSASMAGFALLIERFGVVPAIVAAVALAALGDRGSRPIGTFVLAALLCLGVWLIFAVGLGLPIRAFRGWR